MCLNWSFVEDGTNARLWIKKCSKYSTLCKIAQVQKVDLGYLHMTNNAECWITSHLVVRKRVDWDDFVIDQNTRFRDESSTKIVEKFNKLEQDRRSILMTLKFKSCFTS